MIGKSFIHAFCAVALVSSAALAFDETITVPANRTSNIATFSANTQDCHLIGKPKMTVPVKPKHGTVSFKWIAARLGDNAGICKGRMGHMMGAFYTPDKGYRGADSFRIGMTFPKYEGSTETSYSSEDVNIIVQ